MLALLTVWVIEPELLWRFPAASVKVATTECGPAFKDDVLTLKQAL